MWTIIAGLAASFILIALIWLETGVIQLAMKINYVLENIEIDDPKEQKHIIP